jgi:hypothetical protein
MEQIREEFQRRTASVPEGAAVETREDEFALAGVR